MLGGFIMKPIKIVAFAVIFCLATLAQADVMNSKKGKREALKMGLYPPDIIMRHQKRLGITEAQRSQITGAVKTFQGEVADLQWNMQSEQQQLRQSFAGYTINMDESLAQAEKVLALENQFKLAHFRLLITIKNALTEEQIDTINREIKRKRDGKGGADVAAVMPAAGNISIAATAF
jgi:Spy/CpxP family protein refolding chaperone